MLVANVGVWKKWSLRFGKVWKKYGIFFSVVAADPAVLKRFQSLWLVSSLPNRLKLLEFQVNTKASLVDHRFLPKQSTGSRDTLLVHNVAILTGVYEAALQILTLQAVSVDGSDERGEKYSPTHERGICNSTAESSSSA